MKVTIPRIEIFAALYEPGAYALPTGVIPTPYCTAQARHLPAVLRGSKYVELVETTKRWRSTHGIYVHVWKLSEAGRKWYEHAKVQVNLSEARLIECTEVRKAGEEAFAKRERLSVIARENIASLAATGKCPDCKGSGKCDCGQCPNGVCAVCDGTGEFGTLLMDSEHQSSTLAHPAKQPQGEA